MGIIPLRLHNPTVGFIPTIPLTPDGQTIDPLVSVPIAITHKLAETAAPDPELLPHGLRSKQKGFLTWPPLPLHPLVELSERKLAH